MPWRFALTASLFIAVNLGLAWQQWLVGHAVNDVSAGRAVVRQADGSLDASLGWYWVALIVGVALGRGVLQYAAGVLSLILSQELLTRLRERILGQVQGLHLGYHWQHGMGEMVTRTTRDADKVRDALISFWRQLVETPLVVLAAVGLLGWYHPLLGLVPLLLTVLGLAIFVVQTERLVSLDRAVGAAYDRVAQDLAEGIGGVRVIKSFALEASRIQGFASQVGLFAEHARTALAYAASRIPLPQAVVALGHVWILVYGAHLVADGRIGIGELVTSLLIATTLVFRIEGIGRVMQTFADARSSAERIWQLLDEQPAIRSGTAPLPAGPLGLRLEAVGVSAPMGPRDPPRLHAAHRTGRGRRPGRRHRHRQEPAGQPATAPGGRQRRAPAAGLRRQHLAGRAPARPGPAAPPRARGAPGKLPVLRHPGGQPAPGRARGQRYRAAPGPAPGRRRRRAGAPARGLDTALGDRG